MRGLELPRVDGYCEVFCNVNTIFVMTQIRCARVSVVLWFRCVHWGMYSFGSELVCTCVVISRPVMSNYVAVKSLSILVLS